MSLKDVIGHGRVVGMLLSTVRLGRIASTYMFSGEQGIGKRLAAVNFAKAANCLSPVDGDSCDKCTSCIKIMHGNHTDFRIIEPEKSLINVETARGVEQVLSLKANEARYKTVIIDDAEQMNINASNALLKTLEEPPPQSLIILVTSSPDTLPATIRSRCVRVGFLPLSQADTARVIKASKKDPSNAMLAMGRPGLALKEDALQISNSIMGVLASPALDGEKPPWKDREDIEQWLDHCMIMLRDMAALKAAGTDAYAIMPGYAGALSDACENASLEVIIRAYEEAKKLRAATGYNLNKSVTWNYLMHVLDNIRA